METVQIHYLGFSIQELHSGATITDAIYHLGAKYGAVVYNEAKAQGLITIDEESNTVLVRANAVYELSQTIKTVH